MFQGDLGAEGAVGPVGLPGKTVSVSDHFVRLNPPVLRVQYTLMCNHAVLNHNNPLVYL